jgi:hypothetical protein
MSALTPGTDVELVPGKRIAGKRQAASGKRQASVFAVPPSVGGNFAAIPCQKSTTVSSPRTPLHTYVYFYLAANCPGSSNLYLNKNKYLRAEISDPSFISVVFLVRTLASKRPPASRD